MSSAADRLWGRVVKTPAGCWEFQGARARTNGYGRLSLNGRTVGAHRVAYELTHGSIPDGLHVLHSCDNPPCVNPDHLRLGTHVENIRDMQMKGRARTLCGEDSPSCKLSDADVAEIIRAFGKREPAKAIAARFGISKSYVVSIARGHLRAVDRALVAEALARRAEICAAGHPRTPENTYEGINRDRQGRTRTFRACVLCRDASFRRYRDRKKAAAAALSQAGRT